MPSCVVKNCRNNTSLCKKSQGITFHRFPSANDVWKNNWIQIIRDCRNDTNWNPTKSSIICSIHFDKNYLYRTKGGLLRVVDYAVPTKYLCETSSNREQPTEANRSSASRVISKVDPQSSIQEEQAITVVLPNAGHEVLPDPLAVKEEPQDTEVEVHEYLLDPSIVKEEQTDVVNVSSEKPEYLLDPSIVKEEQTKNVDVSSGKPEATSETESTASLYHIEEPTSPRSWIMNEKLLKAQSYAKTQRLKIKTLNQKVKRLKRRVQSLKASLKSMKDRGKNKRGIKNGNT